MVFLVLALPFSAHAQVAARGEASGRLTLERLYSLPYLIGTSPKSPAWSADGSRVAFLWNDEGRNFHDVWMVDATDPEAEPERVTSLPREPLPTPDPRDPVATAEARDRIERDPGVGFAAWHPDGKRILFSFLGDLWSVAPGSRPTRLTESPGREAQPSFSPSGDLIAFLRGGDLWLMPSSGPASAAVRRTDIAAEGVRVTGYAWSPDGRRLAVMESDVRDVAIRGIPDYLAEETRLNNVRRAYPGEAAGSQRLGVVDAVPEAEGRVAWIEMGAPGDGGRPEMILGYAWAPGGDRLAIDTSDLIAKNRRIFLVERPGDPRSSARLLVREHDPENETFYYWRIGWSVDGRSLYYLSDREEDFHVWAVRTDDRNAQPRRLTQGDWAVASMHPVPGGLIVVGNRGNAEERHIFRVPDGGGEAVRLSRRAGTHNPAVSPDGRRAAVVFSSDGTPPDLLLTTLGEDGSGDRAGDERQVTHSPVSDFSDYGWVTPEYVAFSSHVDGTTLHGRLTLPPDFDPSRSYPAILGSVYTDAVRNQWGGRTAHPTWGLDQYLAQEGYILLNVDMRGSWGRGKEHRRGIRLDYGGMDIEDLESGVRFLETLGYVDMDRVGLWGSSYGGLMTAMSLFRKPGLYAAGIAGAPATSVWHALMGQMAVMLAPEDSPEEYIDSSPVMHAQGLEDPLMIIHGMRDQVVLFKDTITLVQRLIMLGKDVDLVTLPNSGHGWDNESLVQTRFAFKKMVDFFNRHLSESGR